MLRVISLIIVVLSVICGFMFVDNNNDSTEKVIIAYLFPQDRMLSEDELAVEKLTHINYAFADIRNGVIEEGFKYDEENFIILNKTKVRNPDLKIMISVGGWTWSGNFSDMSLTRESRKIFIDSSIRFLERHNLDGIDLDWEFPNLIGYGNIHRAEDVQNFTLLLKEFRESLDEYGKKVDKYFLLTIASGAFDDYMDNTEMDKAHQYLDLINIMAYDLYESDYDSITGHHAPLYTNSRDPKKNSASNSVKNYLALGVPANKIVLGVAFYGRSWDSHSSQHNGLYEAAGPVTKRIGTSFRNIEPNVKNKDGFIRYWDDVSKAPFLYNEEEKIFITYEDEESVTEKCKFIVDQNLRGAMFWEYQSDYESKLIDTLNKELR